MPVTAKPPKAALHTHIKKTDLLFFDLLFFEKKSRQKKLRLLGSLRGVLIIRTGGAYKKAKETLVIGEFTRSFNYPHGRGVKSKTNFSSLLFINPRRRRTFSLRSSLLSLISKKSRSRGIFLLFEVKTVFFEYLHCKALSLPAFSFNSVRIFS